LEYCLSYNGTTNYADEIRVYTSSKSFSPRGDLFAGHYVRFCFKHSHLSKKKLRRGRTSTYRPAALTSARLLQPWAGRWSFRLPGRMPRSRDNRVLSVQGRRPLITPRHAAEANQNSPMHRHHTRRKVLPIYFRAQASILRMSIHSRVGTLIRKPRIRALVINGLRMKPRMRWTEELRRRFPARRRRSRRGFHFGGQRRCRPASTRSNSTSNRMAWGLARSPSTI
jgi:hypothetical protein